MPTKGETILATGDESDDLRATEWVNTDRVADDIANGAAMVFKNLLRYCPRCDIVDVFNGRVRALEPGCVLQSFARISTECRQNPHSSAGAIAAPVPAEVPALGRAKNWLALESRN